MKTPVTRFYQVRVAPPHIEWARIWITDDGCISILSDYGNYGYWFGGLPECGMRAFLVQAGDDYLINKFSAGKREIDHEATEKAIEREIHELMVAGDFDITDKIHEETIMDRVDWSNLIEQWEWARASKIDEAHRLIQTRYPMQVTMFLKELWPIFREQLNAELAEEAQLRGVSDDVRPVA
jgi:hypothetical protein